jgi:DNA helicase-2/ATP-dependent DNA helicase PcrA
VVLTQNYRSTQVILDTARRLIRHNDPERLEIRAGVDKKLVAISKSAGKKIEHRHFDRVSSEADWVAQTIREKFEEKEYQLGDFAVLVRSNADAEPFRQSFNLLGIPYQFSGGGGLYVDPEVRLATAFLKVIGDPADSVSLYALSLSEVYRLNPLDLQKMNTFAARRNYTLHHVFTHLPEFEILADIDRESRKIVQKIMEDVRSYLEFARQKTTGEVLYRFLKQSGYLAGLARLQDAEAEGRLKNLAAFFEKIREFKEVAAVDRVAEFVKYFNILKEAGDDPASARPDLEVDAVNISTVHKAKGLEFAVVFLVELMSGKFPVRERKQPIDLPDALIKEKLPAGDFHLMEERRLFYVGMTRAKKELYLTSAADYGGKRTRKVSRFVLEALDILPKNIAALKKPPLAQIELFAPGEPVIPREIKNEIISLSHYQIDDYLTCPLKYKYIHVLRVPLLPNHQIVYGLALHRAVQAYFSARKDKQRFSEKQLLDAFAHNWSAEGFISRQHEEQRFAAGILALKHFYQKEKKSKRAPKYVEEEFTILEDKIRVRGRWDLVAEEKGNIYIIDFKSAEVRAREEADKRARGSLQLAIYALSWKKMFGRLPDGLELHFIETGVIGRVSKSEINLEAAWEKVKSAANGLRAADYRARPSRYTCSYCPYNEICPSRATA